MSKRKLEKKRAKARRHGQTQEGNPAEEGSSVASDRARAASPVALEKNDEASGKNASLAEKPERSAEADSVLAEAPRSQRKARSARTVAAQTEPAAPEPLAEHPYWQEMTPAWRQFYAAVSRSVTTKDASLKD